MSNITKESKGMILVCLNSEILAFENDLKTNPPQYDHFDYKMTDVREQYLIKLRAAKKELEKL